jgi:hypothetical protein
MKYLFEAKTYNKIDNSKQNITVLDNRLGLTSSLGTSNITNKVNSFVAVYNGNIEWYIKNISQEKGYRNWHIVLTVFLIVFIPIAILLSNNLMVNAKEGVEYFSGLAVAILTSLLGLHKVMNAWLGKRKLLSIFHQASADLKSKFYAFEDEWNNRATEIFKSGSTTDVTKEFDQAIELAITEGRGIANNERKQYFEHIENPEIDLGNILSTSFTQASGLLKNFQSKRFTRRLEEIEAEYKADAEKKKLKTEIASLEKELILYQEWLDEVDSILTISPSNPTLTKRKSKIESDIETTKSALIKKKAQLI